MNCIAKKLFRRPWSSLTPGEANAVKEEHANQVAAYEMCVPSFPCCLPPDGRHVSCHFNQTKHPIPNPPTRDRAFQPYAQHLRRRGTYLKRLNEHRLTLLDVSTRTANGFVLKQSLHILIPIPNLLSVGR